MASRIFDVIPCWGIWAFADGKIDGACYGNEIREGPHLGCDYIGQIVIIPDDGCVPQNIDT